MSATVVSGMLEGAAGWWADWMFQMAWQVAILVIVLSAATYFLRRRSAVFLHALWVLVLVRLVIPPSFAFPTGWGWWLDRSPIQITARDVPVTPTPTVSSASKSETAQPVVSSSDEPTTSANADAFSAELAASATLPATRPGTDTQTFVASEPAATAGAGRPWAIYLLLAWAGVSGTLLVMLGLGSLRIGRWVREATPLTDPALCDMLHECCERLELGGGIELRNSESCTTPVVVGHFQPVILLPSSVIKGLDSTELRTVLIHELQHIRRGDAIFNFIQGVLGAIYFFHPLVWWANRRIRDLREDACDEMTVAALQGVRKPYGSALLKVTEMFGYASPPLALGVMETKHPAHRRLQRILDPNLPTGDRLGWSSFVLLLAFAALLLPAGSGQTKSDTIGSSVTASLPETGLAAGNLTGDAPLKLDAANDGKANAAPVRKEPTLLAEDLKSNTISPPSSAIPSLALNYRWQQGKKYSYSMRIEADGKDQVETFGGTISYKVRSATGAGADLEFTGRLAPSRRIKSPARGFAAGPPRFSSYSPYGAIAGADTSGEHYFHVDNQGYVKNTYGDLQLPFMLGSLSQLLLVPLSGADEKWETTDKKTLRIFIDEGPFPRRLGPFAGPLEDKRLEAREQSTFAREKVDGDFVTIRKEYALKSTEMHNDEPKVDLSGSATIVFDRALGVPHSLEFIGTLVRVDKNFYEKTPLRISSRLLNDADVERMQKEQRQTEERKPLEDDTLDALINDLKSGDDRRVRDAQAKLEKADPSRRRFEVARLLEQQLDNKDNFSRQRAMNALVVWSDTENVPRLLAALDDTFFTVRWGALEALTRLKDPRAAQAIADRYSKDRIKAAAALRGLGSIAEEATASLLADKEWSIRNDACSILNDIGTEKSMAVLDETARGDENGLVRKSAESALSAIRIRGQ